MRKRLIGLALALSLLATGCALYRNDKAWVSDEKFAQASEIYNSTDSLALTEKSLSENPAWSGSEIREALYRLRKLHNLE